jgi:hypothetical protein
VKRLPVFYGGLEDNRAKAEHSRRVFTFSFQKTFPTTPVIVAEPDQTFNGPQELRFRLETSLPRASILGSRSQATGTIFMRLKT